MPSETSTGVDFGQLCPGLQHGMMRPSLPLIPSKAPLSELEIGENCMVDIQQTWFFFTNKMDQDGFKWTMTWYTSRVSRNLLMMSANGTAETAPGEWVEKTSVNWGCSHHLRGNTLRFNIMMVIYTYDYIYVYINTYMIIYGYNVFHRPHPVFSSILYSICARFRDVVHVSEMLCTCQRCCARFPAVVHVSQKLCTFPSSCALFTEVVHVSQKLCTFHKPLITFVFNCIHTERILISKSIGATKHILPT